MRRVASIVLLVVAGVMFPVLVLANWAGSTLYESDTFSERAVEPLNSEAVRLDHPTRDGEGNERIERFTSGEQESTDMTTMANSQTRDIEAALAALPPRDAKVLRLYFGLDDGNSRTLEEIGRMMGVTRERIRQLRDRALLRLREGETGERLRDLVA